MKIDITKDQAKIVLQLLEWHIENLIDEPEDTPRGVECAQSQALFDVIYGALS
jgi:hypothetical protein